MESGRSPRKRPAIRGIYLIVGAVLAIAATATLIVTDNPRLLKTAVIVAVWACVFALLAGARPRRDGDISSSREEELRRTYELEIDREVAARREYELRLEVALRRELENHLKQDLGELRNQVGALRKEIAERWNGELRLERFALRAESTRLTGADRQMLEQQAGRLGLDSPNGGRTEISYDIEQGTSTLPANGRPVQTPGPPTNGQPFDLPPTNGRPFDAPSTNGRPFDAPSNDRPAEPSTNGRPAELANGRPADPPTVRPIREQPAPPAPEPAPEQKPLDPLFDPLPAGLPEPEWTPTNGTYNGGSTASPYGSNGTPAEPSVTISSRRHRRRADDTGDLPPLRAEPANGMLGGPVPSEPANGAFGREPDDEPSYPEAPFRPRMPSEQSGRHGRGAEEEPPRRRRRYRDDDEENDVLARMRQQR